MKPIKLTWQQLIYLHDAHLNKELPGTGPYYDLLREHCADFCQYFDRLISRGGKTYRVRFSSLQARAFMQLWVDQPLPENNSAYEILKLIAEFDQAKRKALIEGSEIIFL